MPCVSPSGKSQTTPTPAVARVNLFRRQVINGRCRVTDGGWGISDGGSPLPGGWRVNRGAIRVRLTDACQGTGCCILQKTSCCSFPKTTASTKRRVEIPPPPLSTNEGALTSAAVGLPVTEDNSEEQ